MIKIIVTGTIVCLIIAYLLGKWLLKKHQESKMVSERLKELVES